MTTGLTSAKPVGARKGGMATPRGRKKANFRPALERLIDPPKAFGLGGH